jgi:hypothetical protein
LQAVVDRKNPRRLNAERRANILRLMREIELQIAALRSAIDLKETSHSGPTLEYWLTLVREQLKNLF